MYADDTIAAIATPAGPGGVGIVRISGPLAAAIARDLFSCTRAPGDWESHRLYRGRIVGAAGAVLDWGLAVMMRAPRSYTGEDVVELHCHGSPAVLRQVLARVLTCGARLAEPGEFTKRAFLNGRLDLAQAEAVIDLVHAHTDAGAAAAAQQLTGQLSEHLGVLRERLIGVKALLEAQIDFSEEDFEVDPAELLSLLDTCIVSVNELIDTYSHGRLLRDGIRVAIIGKPNVGKSSLLNALLGEERAIVTATAGTTRDTIEEVADFAGVPVVLTDTAGLRPLEEADGVERLGMERTAAKIADAQVLLAVLDASQTFDAHDEAVLAAAAGTPRMIVLNKIDLPIRVCGRWGHEHDAVHVSAKTGAGLAELRRRVVALVTGDLKVDGGPLVTNLRHHQALVNAGDSLRLARESIRERRPADLVAVDVQDAIDHIGTITGAVTSEEVLDRIFSEFCIGK